MQIIFTDGLGNQMFQYAYYLAMRAKGRKPKINTGIITRNIVHNGFELCEDFEIDRKNLSIFDGGRLGGGVTIFVSRHVGLLCYSEKNGVYDPNAFTTHKPLIKGYWQDERYFLDIENEVRKSFTFKNIDDENLTLGNRMSEENSVVLHIRRGDYLKYPRLQICTPSYYKRAIAMIKERVENPVFYVFSDDLKWSEEFIKEQGVDYHMVTLNRGRDSYKDMYLMTRCRHNIIANSSFSWWGAWLGEQEGKIVICPDEWTKGSTKHPCPARWLRTSTLNWGGYYLNKRSWYETLCYEYKGLNTGRKPLWLYALRAYFRSDYFKLTVKMRRMFNNNSSSIKKELLHKYGVDISMKAIIGERLHFMHSVGIVVGVNVRIGDDCNIYQGVLLGQSKGLYPTIGNNVTLYPYSCVLGDVHVGNNVIILAHSVVLHDVPDNCMVGGTPARIIKYI